ENVEPTAELVKSVRPESATQKCPQMLWTKIHLHGRGRLQRVGKVADRAGAAAGGTGLLFGPLGEGCGQAEDQRFLAFGTVGFARDAVPMPLGVSAATAGCRRRPALTRGQPQAVHLVPPSRSA